MLLLKKSYSTPPLDMPLLARLLFLCSLLFDFISISCQKRVHVTFKTFMARDDCSTYTNED